MVTVARSITIPAWWAWPRRCCESHRPSWSRVAAASSTSAVTWGWCCTIVAGHMALTGPSTSWRTAPASARPDAISRKAPTRWSPSMVAGVVAADRTASTSGMQPATVVVLDHSPESSPGCGGNGTADARSSRSGPSLKGLCPHVLIEGGHHGVTPSWCKVDGGVSGVASFGAQRIANCYLGRWGVDNMALRSAAVTSGRLIVQPAP